MAFFSLMVKTHCMLYDTIFVCLLLCTRFAVWKEIKKSPEAYTQSEEDVLFREMVKEVGSETELQHKPRHACLNNRS
jgi:hypothetical protein